MLSRLPVLLLMLATLVSLIAKAQESALSPAETLLEQDFQNSKGGIVTLTQTLRLYHYFNAATQGNALWPTYQTSAMRLNQTASDLGHFSGSFWNVGDHDTKLVNAGPGMYLAIEPVVSNSFGHSNYILNFSEGTKFIDVTDPTWKNVSKIRLSPQTIAALLNEGILNRTTISKLGMGGNYFTRITMQNIAADENEKFRDTVSKIFVRNNIVMVAFSWEPTKIKVICKFSSDTAFNYIGSKPTGSLTKDVTSVISLDVVENAVFMSQYPVSQYSDAETKQVQLTSEFKTAIKSGSAANLSPEAISELKQLTYSCR